MTDAPTADTPSASLRYCRSALRVPERCSSDGNQVVHCSMDSWRLLWQRQSMCQHTRCLKIALLDAVTRVSPPRTDDGRRCSAALAMIWLADELSASEFLQDHHESPGCSRRFSSAGMCEHWLFSSHLSQSCCVQDSPICPVADNIVRT